MVGGGGGGGGGGIRRNNNVKGYSQSQKQSQQMADILKSKKVKSLTKNMVSNVDYACLVQPTIDACMNE